MKRILITGMQHDYNGLEAFIMNVYRNIDKNEYQFDFLTPHDAVIACEEEIQSLGGQIYKIEFSMKENILKHFFAVKKFFKENGKKYHAIHMNSCFPNYSLPLKYAKKCGINVRIFHSHNSSDMYVSNNKIKEFIKKIKYRYERGMIHRRATNLLACSDKAGKYMFDSSSFTIVKNGIDIDKFKYDKEMRKQKRKELHINDNIKVLGFIGRLQYQKNPIFLLETLHELIKKDKNYILLIIGVGDKEQEMREYINKSQLKNNVRFLGRREDVSSLYNAMDMFMLPSLFEGLPVVLVEAQANGLPCFISKNISNQARITEKCEFLNIDNPALWADKIMNIDLIDNSKREKYNEIVEKNGFSIKQTINKLEKIYSGEKDK